MEFLDKLSYLQLLEVTTKGNYIIDEYSNIILPKIGNMKTASRYLEEEIFTKFLDKVIVNTYLSSLINNSEICIFTSVFYTDYFVTIDFVDLLYKIPKIFNDTVKGCKENPNIRFFVVPVKLIFSYTKAHSNIILIDTQKNTIELFEPHGDRYKGGTDIPFNIEKHIITLVERLFPEKFLSFTFTNVQNQCLMGVQGLQNISDPTSGHCLAWSLLFIHTKLINLNKNTSDIINYFTQQFKPQELDEYIKLYIGMLETTQYDSFKTIPNFKYYLDLSDEEKGFIKNKIITLTNKYISESYSPNVSEKDIDDIYEELISYHKTPDFDKLFFETINRYSGATISTTSISPTRKKSKLNLINNVFDNNNNINLDKPLNINNKLEFDLDKLFADIPESPKSPKSTIYDSSHSVKSDDTTDDTTSDTTSDIFLSSEEQDIDSEDEELDNLYDIHNI